MEFAYEKWGGHPHRRGLAHHLGDDKHGSWLWGPAGRTMYRGRTAVFVTDQDAVILVPNSAWWVASWWIGHPEVDLYVNINTPAVWHEDRVICIDTDLDVVRGVDGRVEIIDRDEFEAHQVRYRYPTDIVERTERTASRVFQLVSDNEPPFDGEAAMSWAGRARDRDLRPGVRGALRTLT